MIDGVVLYDKPAAITSHDVVARMRRALGARSGPDGRAVSPVSAMEFRAFSVRKFREGLWF